MLPRLAHRIRLAPWSFLSLILALVVLAGAYGRDVTHHLTLAPGWYAPDSDSTRAEVLLREALARNDTPVLVLFQARSGFPADADDPRFAAEAQRILDRLARNPDVRGIDSHYSGTPGMRSAAGDVSYAVVALDRGNDEGVGAFQRLREATASDRLEVRLGGELAAYVDTREFLARDILRTEVASLVLLAVLLLWVFGSMVAAALPLVVGVLSVALAAAALKFIGQYIPISLYAANVVTILGLGLAVDYALFMVSRFREEYALRVERAEDYPAHASAILHHTLETAGRTVLFSGLTVAASLLCLALLPQRFFQNMGLAGSLAVLSAMLTAVLLLPTVLTLLGPRLNRFSPAFLAHRLDQPGRTQAWRGYSRWVVRHAGLALFGSLAALALIGAPMQHLAIATSDSRSLPASAESRQVHDVLAQEFPEASTPPLLVAVRLEGAARDAASLTGLDALSHAIEAMPGVRRVHGLARLDPGFALEDHVLLYRHPDQFPIAQLALQRFGGDQVTLLRVDIEPVPSSFAARKLVRSIRALPLPDGIEAIHVGGYAAAHLDYVESLQRGLPKVILAVALVVGVVLFIMLGSLLLPILAVATSLFSLVATFGGLVWVFQDGNLAGLLDFTPQAGLDGTVLMLIFATAFGLSIDYQLFMLSRIKEMRALGADALEAIRLGLCQSGPIITSAALLIGVVLGAAALGEVVFMKAMGLGLLISVIVDATLMRMLLMPALLRLTGEWSWWAPAPLKHLHARLDPHAAKPEQSPS